jgi:regulator of protease activity HflC (stomatin/prohibitin superfamily)
MTGTFPIFAVTLVVVAGILIFNGVKTVPQGFEWTVERFGRYTRTLHPGLHLLVPMVDRIGHRISMQETVLDVPQQQVITRDNAMVQTDGVVFFTVVDAAAAAYEVRNLILAITNLALTNIRTVIGSLDLDEVLSQRDHINERLLRVVDAATAPWGIKINRIEIKDLTPPNDITAAMARQMKAERERRANILEAEGQKQAAVLRAEGQKQAAILEAEGRREAAFRDAEARERAAEAEARATEMVSKSIAAGDVNALNYFVAQRYTQALEQIAAAPNQRVILLPMETTGVLGSLAGIGELARAAFDRSGAAPTTSARPAPGPWTPQA